MKRIVCYGNISLYGDFNVEHTYVQTFIIYFNTINV